MSEELLHTLLRHPDAIAIALIAMVIGSYSVPPHFLLHLASLI
jgi:hypothetical protein